MAYKLLDMAQARRQRLDGAHLLPLVRAGIPFVYGIRKQVRATKRGRRPRQPRRATTALVLDIDSSVSPTYGAQEGTASNGHFSP